MSKIIDIKTENLEAHPDNSKFFHDIEGEQWHCFKADITKNGILQPLLVAKNEDESYTVLSGHQRLRAAKALQWSVAPCVIWNGDGNHKDILFSANLGRQLTLLERYRLTIHLLDREEDRRRTRERDGNGQFHHLAQNGPNGERPRDRVASMVPGINKHDITTFRRIKELPQPVQQELFKFVEKENPSKKTLKAKVNELNADRRRLKAELRAEKKVKLKKKEMEQLEEFTQADIDPAYRYDAKCFDKTITAINQAAIEIPRLIADVLSFSPLRERTAEMLQTSVDGLSRVLLEQRQLLLLRWEEQEFAADEANRDLAEADI